MRIVTLNGIVKTEGVDFKMVDGKPQFPDPMELGSVIQFWEIGQTDGVLHERHEVRRVTPSPEFMADLTAKGAGIPALLDEEEYVLALVEGECSHPDRTGQDGRLILYERVLKMIAHFNLPGDDAAALAQEALVGASDLLERMEEQSGGGPRQLNRGEAVEDFFQWLYEVRWAASACENFQYMRFAISRTRLNEKVGEWLRYRDASEAVKKSLRKQWQNDQIGPESEGRNPGNLKCPWHEE